MYTYTQPLESDMVDSFCALQKGFTDQFVYYSKERPFRLMGLGRCIAVQAVSDIDCEKQGPVDEAPVLFSFKRFDAENPRPTDELFGTFPNLRFMLPEVVLLENEHGCFLQVNSLGPVHTGRISRFVRHALEASARSRKSVLYDVELDNRAEWEERVASSLAAIEQGRVRKVVPCRRLKLVGREVFSSKDLLVNLIDGPVRGTVFLYRYGDVFFCGCTPELLVRKTGDTIESMCLAGTCPAGAGEEEAATFADWLLHDEKNLHEHEFVVDFMRHVCDRNCYSVDIPNHPRVLKLATVQHLHTPVRAKIMEGRSVQNLASQLHPTPALSGTPVGEVLMLLREIEPFNRGFFGGSIGVVNACGDGEFSVAIRCGVFDGEMGWVYAGCGIVAGSDAASEYDEIDLKLKTILSAFDGGVQQ